MSMDGSGTRVKNPIYGGYNKIKEITLRKEIGSTGKKVGSYVKTLDNNRTTVSLTRRGVEVGDSVETV